MSRRDYSDDVSDTIRRGRESSTDQRSEESSFSSKPSRSERRKHNPLKGSLDWAKERESDLFKEESSYAFYFIVAIIVFSILAFILFYYWSKPANVSNTDNSNMEMIEQGYPDSDPMIGGYDHGPKQVTEPPYSGQYAPYYDSHQSAPPTYQDYDRPRYDNNRPGRDSYY
jgi:hypothetical protein